MLEKNKPLSCMPVKRNTKIIISLGRKHLTTHNKLTKKCFRPIFKVAWHETLKYAQTSKVCVMTYWALHNVINRKGKLECTEYGPFYCLPSFIIFILIISPCIEIWWGPFLNRCHDQWLLWGFNKTFCNMESPITVRTHFLICSLL